MGVLEHWNLSTEELDEIVTANPSLRGFMFGYVGEYKLRKTWFSDSRISNLVKYDNHDRSLKGDLSFTYKETEVRVEVKSLQTRSVRKMDDRFVGKFQCDASDRRPVTLPNRQKIETTCLVIGEFDLLAVCLFEFEKKWQYAFAKSTDLPRSTFPKYTPQQRKYLFATLMEVTWPLQPPFHPEPFRLLDEIAAQKTKRQKAPR
jgi:hypothetical protein